MTTKIMETSSISITFIQSHLKIFRQINLQQKYDSHCIITVQKRTIKRDHVLKLFCEIN